MEKLSKPTLPFLLRTYFDLTKPGILFGNIITATGGFILASRGSFNFGLFLMMLLGLTFIMASGCVLNNCIDKEYDAKMKRTQNRALVKKDLTVPQAIIYATFLGLSGSFFLIYFVNALTLSIALIGLVTYVVFYSYYKHYSSYSTLIGSLAGATPPAIGYCAVSNQFDLGALLIFSLIVIWQMPHFYAIAIYRLEDYTKASLPVLPIAKGMLTTKIHMAIYIPVFISVAAMLTLFHYTGALFLIAASLLGLNWLRIALQGFKCKDDKVWGRKMFLYSLVVIITLSFVIPCSLA